MSATPDLRAAVERWASTQPAAIVRYELREGATSCHELGAELGPARVAELLTQTAHDFAASSGKAVVFRVCAIDGAGVLRGFLPARVHPPAAEQLAPVVDPQGSALEALKIELAHNRALVSALVEQSKAVVAAHAQLGALALARATQESQRADAAEDAARGALDVAEQAAAKAEKAKAPEDPTEALVRSVTGAVVMRSLGLPPEAVAAVLGSQGVPAQLADNLARAKAENTGPAQGDGQAERPAGDA